VTRPYHRRKTAQEIAADLDRKLTAAMREEPEAVTRARAALAQAEIAAAQAAKTTMYQNSAAAVIPAPAAPPKLPPLMPWKVLHISERSYRRLRRIGALKDGW
jgi:hypothetical protein